MASISNRNNISIKSDSAVQLVRELSKLGVFKKRPKRAKRVSSNVGNEIKQDNVMVGYTKNLGGPLGPQMRNIPPIQQIEAGMTQKQIEDIQRKNEAAFAVLTSEVQQQRLEDIQSQQNITNQLAEATANRFGEIQSNVTKLSNIQSKRFRSAQEPGAGSYDPFIQSGDESMLIQDVEEKDFTKTLNEGTPEYEREPQIKFFGNDEIEEGIPTGGGATLSAEAIDMRSKKASGVVKERDAIAAMFNLGPVPVINKNEIGPIRDYYLTLMLRSRPDESIDEAILANKKKLYAKINSILDEERKA
jgi:hypothetical protein